MHTVLFLQVRFKYPPKHLSGMGIKRVLAARLVTPVKTFGDRVLPFRVIWRDAHAWDDIVSQRRRCDQIVAQTGRLQMFVSCISGVFTHPVSAGVGHPTVAKPVYPSVSYWVVLKEDTNVSYSELSLRLWNACSTAQVKYITSTAVWQDDESLASDCGTLFVALKDHNSRYVYQKICRSKLFCGITSQRSNARLAVVAQSKYTQHLPGAVSALKDVGLCMDLEVLGDSDRTPAV